MRRRTRTRSARPCGRDRWVPGRGAAGCLSAVGAAHHPLSAADRLLRLAAAVHSEAEPEAAEPEPEDGYPEAPAPDAVAEEDKEAEEAAPAAAEE